MWFANWFNSSYYHLLYQHRDEQEAQAFIDTLLAFLPLQKGDAVVDLACGKGRHTHYLAQKGFVATGLDLAPDSIAAAQVVAAQLPPPQPAFAVHDMRQALPLQEQAAVLNLFTSFGYFTTEAEHLATLGHALAALRSGGYFVLDFFNAWRVQQHLVLAEEQVHAGVRFRLRRRWENGYFVKDIYVHDPKAEAAVLHFQERVRAFMPDTLRTMLQSLDCTVIAQWGDYQGGAFDREQSPRCILIAQKNEA